MATDKNESINRDLYNLLSVRGFITDTKDGPKDASGKSTIPEKAAFFRFTFMKDGKAYGDARVSIDAKKVLTVYFDNEQEDSPEGKTPSVDYDDTWSGFLEHLKEWSQRRQITSYDLKNKDQLGDDMRQREYYKMKEKLGEGYHAIGKKASYNDAVPSVKIILQHNRALEEGEQRYRNVARIFLENQDGERFLAPTTRPGLARVFAREIAEGGKVNGERWNHIKDLCEEYQQMAGFVRATRRGQFNESAQQLVNEGINHYNNLRETLHKLAGHRGYHAYFESYTPALMEDDGDTSINELFVQETMDPRIESVMPILSRLHKKVSESSSVPVDELAEWADNVISEKLELSPSKPEEKPAEKAKDKEHQELIDFYTKKYGAIEGRKKADNAYAAQQKKKVRTPTTSDDYSDYNPGDTKLQKYEKKAKKKLGKRRIAAEGDMFSNDDDLRPYNKMSSINRGSEDDMDWDDDSWIPDVEDFEDEEMAKELTRHRSRFAANDLNEMEKDLHQGQRHDPRKGPQGPDKTAKMMKAKDAVKAARKALDKAFKGDVDENFIGMSPQAVAEEELDELSTDLLKRHIPAANTDARDKIKNKNVEKAGKRVSGIELALNKIKAGKGMPSSAKVPATNEEQIEEDQFAGNYKTGPEVQWRNKGPKKDKPAKVGDLVGASESKEIDPELARIIEMAKFKR